MCAWGLVPDEGLGRLAHIRPPLSELTAIPSMATCDRAWPIGATLRYDLDLKPLKRPRTVTIVTSGGEPRAAWPMDATDRDPDDHSNLPRSPTKVTTSTMTKTQPIDPILRPFRSVRTRVRRFAFRTTLGRQNANPYADQAFPYSKRPQG